MVSRSHWDDVYTTREADQVSWFQAHAELSLALITAAADDRAAPIIDVGGGASRLADDLLDAGYTDVSVLDLSSVALAAARARLGRRAGLVSWIAGDVLHGDLAEQGYAVWHDRAVFHFLTEARQRRAYAAAAQRALRPGGTLIVATFADDGPRRCSGLPVRRYGPRTLHAEFADSFTLLAHRRESHVTPGGRVQPFVYCLCRRD